jgi:putative methyltransferase (TIGR01177 family)
MMVTVWLSGENDALARAETAAVAHFFGGRTVDPGVVNAIPGRAQIEVAGKAEAAALAGRLALAHRCAEPWPDSGIEGLERRLNENGASHAPAAFQWVSGSLGTRAPDVLHRLGTAYRAGGGRISLDHPSRRFWVEPLPNQDLRLFEEIGVVDRVSLTARRTPRLPFQRPVTLAPKLARTVVNLAEVGSGDRVVDPFVGTGSLLLEAALLGARTVGVDASAVMVRGALENFAHLGQTPEMIRQADAEEAASEFPRDAFDALVTDPPYGRASGTRGEEPLHLWKRTLIAWAPHIRSGGRLSIVVPEGAEVAIPETQLVASIPQRVHRSLTREFRVYVRTAASPGGQ